MLLNYLSYAAVLAAFAFVTLSLASGLLYVSELIEERSSVAKMIGQRGIYVIIVLHVVLYFTESLPFQHTLFSAICHIVYLQNFSHTWPVISLASPSFIGSCVLVITDHFLWFFYFARVSQDVRHTPPRPYGTYHQPTKNTPSFAEIATFFGICVWLAPLFLFLSLSANDNALPTTAIHQADADPSGKTRVPDSRSRSSLFKLMFGNLTAYLPGVGRSRRSSSEGILAPHSPLPQSPSRFSFDSVSPHSPRRSSSIPPPPRSPALALPSEDANGRLSSTPGSSFKLTPPPERLRHPGQRTTVGGLGLRRKTSSPLRGDGSADAGVYR